MSSPIDRGRPASGKAASVLGEQAELIVPYLARFQPARMKASLVPLIILAFILPVSWIAALVLLFVAPLIPIFMAAFALSNQETGLRPTAEISLLMMPKSRLNISRKTAA